jgi:hypothetical protein
VETPMGSDRGRQGQPCRSAAKLQRMENSPVGTRTSKKRMPPAVRRWDYITRRIGQYPSRKAADVDVVSPLKDDATTANGGVS